MSKYFNSSAVFIILVTSKFSFLNFANSLILLSTYNEKMEQWKTDRDAYKEKQSEENNAIDKLIEDYTDGESEAIAKYYSIVIDEIELAFENDRQAEAEYNTDNKMIIMDFLLPTIEDLPKLKKVTYVKSKSEYIESFHTDSHMKKKYDSVISNGTANFKYYFKIR